MAFSSTVGIEPFIFHLDIDFFVCVYLNLRPRLFLKQMHLQMAQTHLDWVPKCDSVSNTSVPTSV